MTSDFLYPFIDGDETDVAVLLADLASSADAKTSDSVSLQATTLELAGPQLTMVAAAMADRFRRDGRLFTFGNGGSATDAASVASLFAAPPWGVPLPARSLVDDIAVVTALGNDVGFDLVFSRQLIAHSGRGDVALGMSTSGNSRNLLTAFHEARARGVLTVGLAGYDGGEMSRSADVDHCLVVRSDSVHRIQEAQAALTFALWAAVQLRLATASVAGERSDGTAGADG